MELEKGPPLATSQPSDNGVAKVLAVSGRAQFDVDLVLNQYRGAAEENSDDPPFITVGKLGEPIPAECKDCGI